MRRFAVLTVLLISVGVFVGLYLPAAVTLGGWITGLALLGLPYRALYGPTLRGGGFYNKAR